MDWIEVEKDTHKIQGCIWVECVAEIRNNATGEIREHETHEILSIVEEYPSVFNWKENNFSCDCNRRIFFNSANGEDTKSDIDCSNGQFSVNLKNKKDGVVYYREFDN